MAKATPQAAIAVDPDPHTLLVEANAQLNGIRNLTAETPDDYLHHLTGFELDMLLLPITERLSRAMTMMEEKLHE